jgi:hypothetical protein
MTPVCAVRAIIADHSSFGGRGKNRLIYLTTLYSDAELDPAEPTLLPRRYDAFLYIDQTRALRPLHVLPHLEGEVPETYPSGV